MTGGAKHINRSRGRWRADTIPMLMQQSLAVIFLGIAVSVFLCIVVFAVIYFLLGEDCYRFSEAQRAAAGPFSFEQMFALSVHVFTMVAFGSITPTCGHTQFFIVIEQYCAMLLASVAIAVVLARAMEPHPQVQWSRNVVIAEQEGDPRLSVRMARISGAQLGRCRAELIATVQKRGSNMMENHVLELESNSFINFEHCALVHHINQYSPLYGQLEDLHACHLTLTVYDLQFHKDCMMFHSWEAEDIIRGAAFNDMLDLSQLPYGGDWFIDHAKLNSYRICGALDL